MTKTTLIRCVLAWAVWLVFAAPIARAGGADQTGPLLPGVPVNERVIAAPVGGADRVLLQVTLMTPPGPGPFPLVVMNHGADGAMKPQAQPRYRKTFSALYFLSRGYAVALPMMRGYAGSQGRMISHGCDVARSALENARDIQDVIADLAGQPDIDASRVIVAGQSFGGWNTLAFGALNTPNVVGLINFVGGIRVSSCDDDDPSLIDGAGDFGRKTTVASIWFYGDNDSLFSPLLWRTMYQRYVEAGGKAELVAVGRFNTDSHQLLSFPESLPIWTPRVDAFLGRIGMPNRPAYPQYLPPPTPPPTGFAAIGDVAAVPYLNDAGRALYRRYLAKPIPKLFMISPGGYADAQYGGFDPVREGQARCRQQRQVCRPYAVDNDVVWTPAPSLGGAPDAVR
jgi:dienelactone hydrolase